MFVDFRNFYYFKKQTENYKTVLAIPYVGQ